MYSSRRRYRRYQSKKYYRNNLFAPSLKKAPAPNYYQMKGRILQQSPRLIQEPPTEIINRDKLDKMYQTLVEYKYKFPPVQPSYYTTYNFYLLTNAIAFSDLPVGTTIDKTLFQQIVDQSDKPPLPSGYHYEWDVVNLIVNVSPTNALDNSRFSLVWYCSVLINGNATLIQKTGDSTFTNSCDGISYCISPGSPNICRGVRPICLCFICSVCLILLFCLTFLAAICLFPSIRALEAKTNDILNVI